MTARRPLAQELAKFGAQVTVEEDRVTVLPCPLHAPNEELDGHNDHRIVMAMAVLRASLGGTIRGAEAANKIAIRIFSAHCGHWGCAWTCGPETLERKGTCP